MAETISRAEETKRKASRSSFYLAMRLMPRAEREAMFAIYAFSRAVDDIADDGNGTRAARRTELDQWRGAIGAIYDGAPSPRADFLAGPVRRFELRREDFLSVIDGMEMDVVEDIRAPDLPKLDLYCERVASAVGRLSIKVFGMDEGAGFELAHHLGRALQLTNILRDLDQDAAVGRLYLPHEYLAQAGIADRDPKSVIANPDVDKACARIAHTAHGHYRKARALLRARPRGLLRAPRLMSAVYSHILTKMQKEGWAPPRRRVRIGRGRLLLIVLLHGLSG